jgi:peptidoglycan/xylan/chitin deacetylase (PgdA/CDA1 family)
MQLIKEKFNSGVRGLAETLGFIFNPLLLSIKGENSQLLIFYFHGLYQSLEQRDLNHIDPQKNMTVSQFHDFVDYFINCNYKFIRPEDLLSGLETSKKYAMITFDDGYYNNMLALPVLEEFNIPAVFFITADNVKENKAFWWDVIYKYRTKQGISGLKIQKEQEMLKSFKYEHISDYITKNFGKESSIPWSDIDRPMTEQEVKITANNPYAVIGNHTYHHALLPNYNKNELEEEISRSNDFLRSLTGITPISIAFPNGYYNELVLDVIEAAGFRVAFSAVPGKNNLPIDSSKLICLKRFMSNNNNIKRYGSFFRLGYTPGSLFSKIKESFHVELKHGYLNSIKQTE